MNNADPLQWITIARDKDSLGVYGQAPWELYTKSSWRDFAAVLFNSLRRRMR
jgi:hypothetical protein